MIAKTSGIVFLQKLQVSPDQVSPDLLVDVLANTLCSSEISRYAGVFEINVNVELSSDVA